MRHLVLILRRLEFEFSHFLHHIAQIVAARNLILDFGENHTHLKFDGVGIVKCLESLQIGKQAIVDKFDKVVARKRLGYVVFAIVAEGHGPHIPAKFVADDARVVFAHEHRAHFARLLQIVEIFQEKHPGRLLHIVEGGRAALIVAQRVVDSLKYVFKSHNGLWFLCVRWLILLLMM